MRQPVYSVNVDQSREDAQIVSADNVGRRGLTVSVENVPDLLGICPIVTQTGLWHEVFLHPASIFARSPLPIDIVDEGIHSIGEQASVPKGAWLHRKVRAAEIYLWTAVCASQSSVPVLRVTLPIRSRVRGIPLVAAGCVGNEWGGRARAL